MLLTENPSINLSAKSIIKALITNRNRPKVMIVIGKVKIISIGFTNRFKMDKTRATITAVKYVSTFTPFNILARITTAIAFSNKRKISFI